MEKWLKEVLARDAVPVLGVCFGYSLNCVVFCVCVVICSVPVLGVCFGWQFELFWVQFELHVVFVLGVCFG
jgi:GMP synthase-like glutamine amidotransferase